MAVDSPKVPLTNEPGKTNWVEKYGALKPHSSNWIYRTAEHLKGKGRPESIAIPTAVNAARRGCKTGDLNFPGLQQVNAASRAEMCAAVARWDAARARAKAASDLAAERYFRAVDLAGARLARGLDLTASQREALDLAANPFVPSGLGKMPISPATLYDVAATVKRLRRSPKLKGVPDSELRRIAALRIRRRQLRNRLGITTLKNLPHAQIKALERAGLVGGAQAHLGQTVNYTIQRGPRRGQTVTVKFTKSGWHEVKPRQNTALR